MVHGKRTRCTRRKDWLMVTGQQGGGWKEWHWPMGKMATGKRKELMINTKRTRGKRKERAAVVAKGRGLRALQERERKEWQMNGLSMRYFVA